jgi:cbb3-type cytochrome oxidase maturation protein
MTPLVWLMLISLSLGAGALALFLWSLRAGQYEDLEGASQRILFDE